MLLLMSSINLSTCSSSLSSFLSALRSIFPVGDTAFSITFSHSSSVIRICISRRLSTILSWKFFLDSKLISNSVLISSNSSSLESVNLFNFFLALSVSLLKALISFLAVFTIESNSFLRSLSEICVLISFSSFGTINSCSGPAIILISIVINKAQIIKIEILRRH